MLSRCGAAYLLKIYFAGTVRRKRHPLYHFGEKVWAFRDNSLPAGTGNFFA
jgi:hypothetical protein